MLKEELEQDCEKAIQQIEEKMYAKEYEDEYEEVFCYGISCYKKRCMIENLKENGDYQI